MKLFQALGIVFVSVGLAFPAVVFYDLVTGDVKTWVRTWDDDGVAKYLSSNPDLGVTHVSDASPLLNHRSRYLKVNLSTKKASLKSDSEITAVKTKDVNAEVTSTIIQIQQRIAAVDSLLSDATNQALIDGLNTEKTKLNMTLNNLKAKIQ